MRELLCRNNILTAAVAVGFGIVMYIVVQLVKPRDMDKYLR